MPCTISNDQVSPGLLLRGLADAAEKTIEILPKPGADPDTDHATAAVKAAEEDLDEMLQGYKQKYK